MARFSVVPSGDGSSPEGGAGPVTPDAGETLADLLAQAARGDEGAFGVFYDRTSARVHGLVRRVVRDPAQSEEVTQEVFLELWRQSSRFDPSRGSVLAWALTIAHRKAVDRVRSSEASRGRDASYGAAAVDVAHDHTSEAAVGRLEAERVRRALDTLTDAQRRAIELAYFSGYTHTEVASLLSLPLGTAKTRIRDGLIRLRDTLGVTS
ncbi:ECF RNA polymerase sigma factor SigK [Intrasporangium calvum]|uniref:ECF RNA polymerase sigma factor SigK n=1 Tax=Intrasporangium calvum TaxID=53358 RepID=A0ABT5GDJ6_9MICO|nr:ECF RNA polymerase sigma factor SigK [Intrasporangium calvum]MDC5696342.1 ECF RNA polymerase sigma factor SigK [Intrasporangium calvum]